MASAPKEMKEKHHKDEKKADSTSETVKPPDLLHHRSSSLSLDPKVRFWVKIQVRSVLQSSEFRSFRTQFSLTKKKPDSFLPKGSKFLNWKRRYVVIDDEKMRWWKDEKEVKMKEITEINRVPLKGCAVHLRHLKNAFGLAMRHTFSLDAPFAEHSKEGVRSREINKTFNFAVESDSERDHIVSELSRRLGSQTSRILVTGATGSVGRLVVEALSKKMYVQVLAAVRDLKAPIPSYGNVSAVEFDFTKPDTMAAALKGVDRVFFLSQLDPVMVQHAKNFLELAKQSRKLTHIVRLSNSGADIHDFQIGKWHHEVEQELAKCGKTVTILRPTSFYQNFGNFWAKHIKTTGGWESPIPNAKVAYGDAKDAAEVSSLIARFVTFGYAGVIRLDNFVAAQVAAAILTRPPADFAGKAIELSGPEALTHYDVSAILSSVLGKKLTYKECDNATFIKGLEVLNAFPANVAEAIGENYQHNFASQRRASIAGAESIQRILARKPITFAEYAKRQAADFIVAKLTVLITTSGNVGLAVLRALKNLNLPASALSIRVAVRRPEKTRLVESIGAEAVMVDTSKRASLESALTGVDRLVLIPPFATDLGAFCDAWTDAARTKHVAFVLKSSAINVRPRLTSFARMHDDSDKHLAASGIPYTFCRPSLFMSAPANQTANVLATGKLYQGFGQGKVSMVDPRDVGDVYAKIIVNPADNYGKSYEVTGGVALSYYEAAEVFSKVLNKPVQFVELSEERLLQGLRASGMAEGLALGVAEIARFIKEGGMQSTSDIVTKLLGRPPLSFEAHLRYRLLHKDFEAISRVDSRYLPVARNTVIVTGASGLLGHKIVTALLTRVAGWQVRAAMQTRGRAPSLLFDWLGAADDSWPQATEMQALGAEICPVNHSQPSTLVAAAKGARKAVLMIPLAEEYMTLARGWSQAIKDCGTIKLVIFVSPARLPGQFAQWAAEVELHLTSLQLPFVSVRPTPMMYNVFRLWGDSIHQVQTIFAPLGKSRVRWLDPNDLAEVIALLTVAPSEDWQGKVVNLSGPRAFSAQELAEEVSQATGKSVRFVQATPQEARNHLPVDQRSEVLVRAWCLAFEGFEQASPEQEDDQIEKLLGRKAGDLAAYLAKEAHKAHELP